MSQEKHILVTGATGKAGRRFIDRVLSEASYATYSVRALCHNRTLDPRERLEVVTGSIEHRAVLDQAMRGVTHVLHLATCKETPETIMDVAVKGLFWLLESCRVSPTFAAVHPDRRRRRHRALRLPAPGPRDRDAEAHAPIRAATRSPRCWKR